METNQPFLKTCGCMSLRAGTIYIGILELLFYTLYFISEIVSSIVYVHKVGENEKLRLYSTIELMLLIITISLHIVFALYLLYGAIWKSTRGSTFIFAWLMLKAIAITTSILEIFTDTIFHFSFAMFYTEGVVFVFQIFSSFIVFNYYRTLPAIVL